MRLEEVVEMQKEMIECLIEFNNNGEKALAEIQRGKVRTTNLRERASKAGTQKTQT